jgi:predicted ATPase/DNA-binding SARP family transcriptional activator
MVRVRLLGGFGLTVDDRPADEGGWRLRKARTLVKLLALAPGHRLHREQVVEILWPGRPPAAAANNLHQALHVARRQLAGAERLRLDDDVLVLCGGERLWIDAEAFREEATSALRTGEPERARSALALYGGELLPEDLYEEWTEPARGELEHLRDEVRRLAEGGPAPGPRDNLPADATRFIGRDAALGEVARLLARSPLLTLTGTAGCGKTRLALEAAARARAAHPDGVWLVELAGLAQPELIPDAIAGAAGVKLGGRPLAEALATRETLIVLDSCEHLVEPVAEIVGTLLRRCPGVSVLATSREALRVAGEVVLRVPSMEDAEAVRLFADRAAAADPGFAITAETAEDVAGICSRLDGIPLAIELAAARVEALPVAEIARRLRDSFGLLGGQRRTLEAALDWSFRLLDADEARLLPQLTVFAGGFGADAVAGICGDEDDVLLRLVRKSLVVAGEAGGRPRFRLLEMVREHARSRLAGDAALRERHARWYAALEDVDSDLEGGNLRAALSWLVDHDPPAAVALADRLSDAWLLRGRLAEGRGWLERAVGAAPEGTDGAAEALLSAVAFAGRAGDLAGGERLVERSLAGFRARGDRAGASRALHMRGLQAWLRGDLPAARDALRAARDEARMAGSAGAEANAVHALAVVAICTRDLTAARRSLGEALDLLDRQGDGGPGLLVVAPGFVPVRGTAHAVQEESQLSFRAAGGRLAATAHVRMTLALVERLDGNAARADVVLGDALARVEGAGDEAGIAQALAATGRLATLQGDAPRARDALGRSLEARRRLGDVRGVGVTLGLLAELAALEGEPDRARGLLRRAHAMFEQAGDRPGVLWMMLALARTDLAGGEPAAARTWLAQSLALCEAVGASFMRGWVLAWLAQADRDAGAVARAGELLAEARAAFTRSEDPWGLELCDALAPR